MNRIIVTALIILFVPGLSFGQVKKSQLPQDNSPTTDDIMDTVDNPNVTVASGGSINKKVPLSALRTLMLAGDGSNLTGMSKSQVGLGNVENTALSTWAGSSNLNVLKFVDSSVTALPSDATKYLDGTGHYTVPSAAAAGGFTDGGTFVSATTTTDNVGIGTITQSGTAKLTVAGTIAATTFLGNATTATLATSALAFSANPQDCNGGAAFPTGVDASGGAEHCTTLIRPVDVDSSAELAAILTDETGTGLLVFSVSPKFTANVGIGSATPGQALDVQGTTRSTYFSGDGSGLTNVAGWSRTSNKVTTISTDNVGVGTAQPGNLLDVGTGHHFLIDASGYPIIDGGLTPSLTTFGHLSSDSNAWATSRGALTFFDGTASTFLIGALTSDSWNDGDVPTIHTGGVITWDTPTGGGGSATITAADTQVIYSNGANNPVGNVGLGFNQTTAVLTANGGFSSSAVAKPSIQLPAASTDSDWIIGVNGSGGTDDDALNIGIGTTVPDMLTKLVIKRDGNIGIGTTNPPNNLYVAGTVEGQGFKLPGNGVAAGYVLTATSVGIGTWMPSAAAQSSQWTTVAAGINYNSAANVGIGSVAPRATLDVAGTVRATDFMAKTGEPMMDVRAYGATGDGTTDDYAAIQAAVTAASGHVLWFPKPSVYYKITDEILLPSNITIKGDMSRIHMPAQADIASIKSIFRTNNAVTTSNVDISGLQLTSTAATAGADIYLGANTSYVMGINLHNTSDIRVHDVTMDAMVYGFKIDTTLNTKLFFNNIKIINSGTPVYGSNITDAYFSNMYLDSTGYTGTDGHLHSFYFETTVNGIYFNNVAMANTAGACIQLYQSGGTGVINFQGKNLSCKTAADFMIVWAGAKDIKVDGFRATGVTKVLNFDDAHNVQLSHGYVELKTLVAEAPGYTASDHVTLDHIQIDASTKTADSDLFSLNAGSYITLSDLDVYGITANDRVVFDNSAALTDFQLKDSEFYFAATPADNPVTLRNALSTGKITGNKFINQGTATTNAVFYNPSNARSIFVSDNTIYGFPKVAAGSDTGTVDIANSVNGYFVTNSNQLNNVGMGTWVPASLFDVMRKLNVTAAGNVGIGSVNPGKNFDIGSGLSVRAVGLGTTVPAPLCRKADGTFGTYTGTAWANVCN